MHSAPAASVADDYKVPTITVPYAWHKPTLDGIVHDDEWQDAVSFSALQTTNHAVSPRQTRFWMMWDADNIYLAMRSPLRPGERLIQALRQTDKDVNVVFDDSYEIWLDVGSHSPDGQPVFFQYLSNFAGARLRRHAGTGGGQLAHRLDGALEPGKPPVRRRAVLGNGNGDPALAPCTATSRSPTASRSPPC